METKICKCCGKTFPNTTEYFYRHKCEKDGLTSKCKQCINIQNKLAFEKRKALYPELIRQQQLARSKKHYHKDIEKSRKKCRDSAKRARQDPIRGEKIKARKRGGAAGLTPEQIEAIKIKQNNKCAICGKDNPTNLDHDHKTGKVRWLLCCHCNRGLGAFYDSPELLRKAASLLEEFNNDTKSK